METSINQLADELEAKRKEATKRMSLGDRFFAGPRLFEQACSITKAGIRLQHPSMSEKEVHHELIRRLQVARRLDGEA